MGWRVSAAGRGLSRAGFVLLGVVQFIAVQIALDARSGVLNAKAAWRSWMTHKWPQLPAYVRAPLFAVGVSARALYRGGHYGGRTIAIGARNGFLEGRERHREHLELARYPKGTDGYLAVADRIRVDRMARREEYLDYAEKVHQGATQERAERAMWAKAATLQDAGELTARWAEGAVLFHPGGYDEGPDEETLEIAPALATLNRSGFVTSQSQPGCVPEVGFKGYIWRQRAAVDGFTDKVTADRLEQACAEAGLLFIRNGPPGWRNRRKNFVITSEAGVDSDSGAAPPYYPTFGFGSHPSRRQVKFEFDGYATDALLAAEHVAVIDPIWGRNTMWDVLTEAVDPPCCPCRRKAS